MARSILTQTVYKALWVLLLSCIAYGASAQVIVDNVTQPTSDGTGGSACDGSIEISIYGDACTEANPCQVQLHTLDECGQADDCLVDQALADNGGEVELIGLCPGMYVVKVYNPTYDCTFMGETIELFLCQGETPSISSDVTQPCNGDSSGGIDLSVSGGTSPYTYAWNNGTTVEDLTGQMAGTYAVTVTDACGEQVSEEFELELNLVPFSTNDAIISPDCGRRNKGSIDLSGHPDVEDFNFLWSTGAITPAINGLDAGTFEVIITNPSTGCGIVLLFEIEDVTSNFSLMLDNITHNNLPEDTNGSISISCIGTSTCISYEWSNGQTGTSIQNLSSGMHSVTITTEEGCEFVETYEVTSCVVYEYINVDGELQQVAVNNIEDFDVQMIGGLGITSDSEVEVGLLVKKDGENDYTELHTGNEDEYIITWALDDGTIVGNGATPDFDDSIFGNEDVVNITITISNGCHTKTLEEVFIRCGANDSETLSDFFIIDSDAPCSGAIDGRITIRIPHPSGAHTVSVLIDGLEYVDFDPDGVSEWFTIGDLAGLSSGNHTIVVESGGCTYEFSFFLEEQPFDRVLDEDASDERACVYDLSCNGVALGQETSSPFIETNSTIFTCNGVFSCDGVRVGRRRSSRLRLRGYEYRLLMMAMNFESNLISSKMTGVDNCDYLTICPIDMNVISKRRIVVNRGSPTNLDNGCHSVPCSGGGYITCIDDILQEFSETGIEIDESELDNDCTPAQFPLYGLLVALESGNSECFSESLLEELEIYEDAFNTNGLDPRIFCATVWVCLPDYEFKGNNINEFCPTCITNTNGWDTNDDGLYDIIRPNCGDNFEMPVPTNPIDLNSYRNFDCTEGLVVSDDVYVFTSPVCEDEKLDGFHVEYMEDMTLLSGIVEVGGTTYNYPFTGSTFTENYYTENVVRSIIDWNREIGILIKSQVTSTQFSILFEDLSSDWNQVIESNQSLEIDHLSLETDGFVVGGVYSGNLNYDGIEIGNTNAEGIFLLSLDFDGNVLSSNVIDNINTNSNAIFASKNNGNTLIAGEYANSEVLINDASNTMSGESGVFVVELDASGNSILLNDIANINNGTFELLDLASSKDDINYTVAINTNQAILESEGVALDYPINSEQLVFVQIETVQNITTTFSIESTNINTNKFDITYDNSGQFLAGITFTNTINIDANTTLQSNGLEDVGLLIFDGEGTLTWHQTYGSEENENISKIFYENEKLYFGGEFIGERAGVELGEGLLYSEFCDKGKVYMTCIVTPRSNCIDITVNGSAYNAICESNTGRIVQSVQGSTSPYNYQWSSGQSTASLFGISAGTYTVTITDIEGCSVVETYNVGSDELPIDVNYAITPTNCNGMDGAIEITSISGEEPYSFEWNTGSMARNIHPLSAGLYSVTVTDANGCTTSLIDIKVEGEESPITITSNVQNTVCGGASGLIRIKPHGGQKPYAYVWSNGETTKNLGNLNEGSYTVTVTDANGCSTELTEIIGVKNAPEIMATITPANCGLADGSIALVVSGGRAPYIYEWSDRSNASSIVDLEGGTYTVTVTDRRGCAITETFIIPESENPVLMLAETAPTSASSLDGEVNLTVTNGTASYTYAWSNGATSEDISGLAAGTYSVTVTDANGCSAEDSVVLEVADCGVEGVVIQTTCGENNGSIELVNNNDSNVNTNYTWNDTGRSAAIRTDLVPGLYEVSIIVSVEERVSTSPICITTLEFRIYPSIGVTIDPLEVTNPSIGENNGAINLTVATGTAPYTYAWSNGATSEDLSGLAAGTYSVTVTDANGCSAEDSVVLEETLLCDITHDITHTTCGEANGTLELNNSNGYTTTYSLSNESIANRTFLDNGNGMFSELSAGTYQVSVVVKDEESGVFCTTDFSVTINESTGVTVEEPIVTDASGGLNNGAINLTVATGTAPYTYAWSNGATTKDVSGLAAADYTVTITDANGCTLEETITVGGEECNAIVEIEATNPSCADLNNGTVEAVITNVGGTYTYVWDDATNSTNQIVDDLGTGTYSVTVTEIGGCTYTSTTIIEAPSPLTLTMDVVVPSESTDDPRGGDGSGDGTPSDGSVTAVVSGGTEAYTYLWSNGATTASIFDLVTGDYTVTVTDANGCTIIGTAILDQCAFTVSTGVGGQSDNPLFNSCNGGLPRFQIENGSGEYLYIWNASSLPPNTSEEGNIAIAPSDLEVGDYTVTIIDTGVENANGVSTISILNVLKSGGILDLENLCHQIEDFSIIINPEDYIELEVTADFMYPSCNEADGYIHLTVTDGLPPYQFEWTRGAITLSNDTANLDNLEGGPYLVKVTDATGCTKTQFFNLVSSESNAIAINWRSLPTCSTCSDGSLEVIIDDNIISNPSIQWSNGATTAINSGLLAGNYSVIVTSDSGCQWVDDIYLIAHEDCDGDGIPNHQDNCDCVSNPDQADSDGDGLGDVCDNCVGNNGADSDLDGVPDNCDNCPNKPNPTQTDTDGDGTGDACDDCASGGTSNIDNDGDSWGNSCDNCPTVPNTNQADTDNDGIGDACDNCPNIPNTNQSDSDNNGEGDPCDGCDLSVSLNVKHICSYVGGEIRPSVSGGTLPYTYAWSDGDHQEDGYICMYSTGTYSLTVTDVKGCQAISSATVNDYRNQQLDINVNPTPTSCTDCSDGSAEVIITTSLPMTYSYIRWQNVDSGSIVGTGSSISELIAGNYRVYVQIYGIDCLSGGYHYFTIGIGTSNNTTSNIIMSSMILETKPNPFKETLEVSIDSPTSQKGQLRLVDITGRTIYQEELDLVEGYNTNTINTGKYQLSDGVYYLLLTEESGKTHSQKVVHIQ